MELISTLLSFGKLNAGISIGVTFTFLFLYSVVILRKRRAVSEVYTADLNELELLARNEEVSNARLSAYNRVTRNKEALEALRNGSGVIDAYNHMLLAGFAFCIPVYFLWLPALILTLPIGLALACVYPDKVKALLAKTVAVDKKPASQ